MNADEKQKLQSKSNDLVITAVKVREQVKEVNEKVKKIMMKALPAPPK